MCVAQATYDGGRGRRRGSAWPAAADGSPRGLHFGVDILALVVEGVVLEPLLCAGTCEGGVGSCCRAGAAGDPSASLVLGHVVYRELVLSRTVAVRWRVGVLGLPVGGVLGGVGDLLEVGRRACAVLEGWTEIKSNLSGWPHQPGWLGRCGLPRRRLARSGWQTGYSGVYAYPPAFCRPPLRSPYCHRSTSDILTWRAQQPPRRTSSRQRPFLGYPLAARHTDMAGAAIAIYFSGTTEIHAETETREHDREERKSRTANEHWNQELLVHGLLLLPVS